MTTATDPKDMQDPRLSEDTITVCKLAELGEGEMRLVEFDAASCTVECPRHGSLFDLTTGKPRTLPAYRPVETFAVRVDGDDVKVEL